LNYGYFLVLFTIVPQKKREKEREREKEKM